MHGMFVLSGSIVLFQYIRRKQACGGTSPSPVHRYAARCWGVMVSQKGSLALRKVRVGGGEFAAIADGVGLVKCLDCF